MADTARDVVIATRRRVDAMVARAEGPELLRILDKAQKHLDGRVRQLARFGSDATWTGQHVRVALALVDDAVVQAKRALNAQLADGAAAMTKLGRSSTIAIVRAGEAQYAGIAYEIPVDVAMRMSHRVQGVLSSRLRQFPTSVDRYGRMQIAKFEEFMQVGVLARQSVGQMIDRLVRHGGPKGPDVSLRATVDASGAVRRLETMSTKEGLFRESRYFAERIVRTEMLAAVNGAAQATMEVMGAEDPKLMRQILAHFDARTASDSIFVSGEIRRIDEPFVDGAGRVFMTPPARPNDREIIVPYRTNWPVPASFRPRPAAEREGAATDAKGEGAPAVEESMRDDTRAKAARR